MHHFRKLSNGLRLVTIPLHDTKAITVLVLVKVGSRYETRSLSGASHFLEHLLFKGTKRRPSSLALTKLLDGVGASYNAFTSKDSTGYYVKINAEHTELALDILSDMLRNSLFKPAEINRERGVIIEEIKMYEENPVMTIEDLFEAALFGDHHPLGWNILGPRKNIQTLSRAKLLSYRQRYYQAGNILVVAAGHLPERMTELVQKYFGPMSRGSRPPTFQAYRTGTGSPVALKHRPTEQVQLALGVRGLAYRDRRLPTLSVLTNILGGTMSSRLFVEVREKRGLAYSIGASLNPYEDTGAVAVQAGLDHRQVRPALKVILNELRRLGTSQVGPTELRRAKEYIRGRTILDLEDSDALAGWYGRQGLFERRIQAPNDLLTRIQKVSAAEIQVLAKKLFRPDRYRLAMIGPETDERPWRTLLRAG